MVKVPALPVRILLPEEKTGSPLVPLVVMNPWPQTHPHTQMCPERIELSHLATFSIIPLLHQRQGRRGRQIRAGPTWSDQGANMPALAVKRRSFRAPGLDARRKCVILKVLVLRERTLRVRHMKIQADIAVRALT